MLTPLGTFNEPVQQLLNYWCVLQFLIQLHSGGRRGSEGLINTLASVCQHRFLIIGYNGAQYPQSSAGQCWTDLSSTSAGLVELSTANEPDKLGKSPAATMDVQGKPKPASLAVLQQQQCMWSNQLQTCREPYPLSGCVHIHFAKLSYNYVHMFIYIHIIIY